MRELSLFSGAGGGLLATKHLLGWTTVGYVEIDDYCQRVIAQRIKDGYLDKAPIFGDIRTFADEYASEYTGLVDVVTGGFPCQDISCAGKGAGIDGERSGLWGVMATVIRIVRPRYVFVENSPMLTIRGLGRVIGELASMGFYARWGVFSACAFGAPHTRERMFIVAHAESERWLQCRWIKQQAHGAEERNICFWRDQSEPLRMAYGLANRMDRVKSAGNGQVPIVAATAWRLLSGARIAMVDAARSGE